MISKEDALATLSLAMIAEDEGAEAAADLLTAALFRLSERTGNRRLLGAARALAKMLERSFEQIECIAEGHDDGDCCDIDCPQRGG